MSGHGHEDDQPQVMFIGPNGAMTAEEFQREQDRVQATNEVFWNDVRRLLFQELERDQLHTLKHLFRLIGDSERSQQWASYFEGMADAGEHVKALSEPLDFDFGQAEAPAGEATLWSHPFLLKKNSPSCGECGLPLDTKPHRRWDAGLRGDGADGVDL